MIPDCSQYITEASELIKQAGRLRAYPPTAGGSRQHNTLLWNGRSRTGTKVPSGRYLVKITAATEAGTQQQMMVPLWLSK